jgi:hypothetical protein
MKLWVIGWRWDVVPDRPKGLSLGAPAPHLKVMSRLWIPDRSLCSRRELDRFRLPSIVGFLIGESMGAAATDPVGISIERHVGSSKKPAQRRAEVVSHGARSSRG